MGTHKKILITAAFFALILVITITTISIKNNNKSNAQRSQDECINLFLKGIENEELDEVDAFYFELLEDNYFAIFNKEADRKEREKIYYYATHQDEAILEMCKQPPNMYGMVVLYDIDREKGLLECETYDKIYFDSEYLDGYDFRKVIIEIGDRKEIYLIRITPDIYIRRVSATKIKEIDKYGNIIDTIAKRIFDEKNTRYNFNDLCLDGEKVDVEGWYGRYYGDDVAVSKHFREKYPNFLDLFIHYSPIEYNHITLTDLDIENQKATFEVDSVLECKKRTYVAEYILDNDFYLFDVHIELLNEFSYNADEYNRIPKIIYHNSNWNHLKLTNNFLSKYNTKTGVLCAEDFNNAIMSNVHKDNNSYLYRVEFVNKTIQYYAFEKIEDVNGYIDEIIVEKLNFGNVSMRVAENLYKQQFMNDAK